MAFCVVFVFQLSLGFPLAESAERWRADGGMKDGRVLGNGGKMDTGSASAGRQDPGGTLPGLDFMRLLLKLKHIFSL